MLFAKKMFLIKNSSTELEDPPLHIYGTHPSSNILGCLMPTNLTSSNDIVNAMSDDKVWNITKQTGQTAHTLSL